MGKRVAIVQSSYIPWKGYFDLIGLVDEFILLDDVQFTRRDWRNRNRIKTRDGLKWLTIPVANKGNYRQKINEMAIADPGWAGRHWETIRHHYGRARYFKEYRGWLEELFLKTEERLLSRVNHRFITAICQVLGVRTRVSFSMDYRLAEGATERLVDLCLQAGASEYLSGPSGRDYLDEELFAKSGLKLQYMDYSGYPEYEQPFPPFEHKVSIIDLILNTGPAAGEYMKFSAPPEGERLVRGVPE